MQDINKLLSSLDPETLQALSNIDPDELKKAINNPIKEEVNEEPKQELPKTFKTSTTKVIETRYYHVTITPDEWEYQAGIYCNTREVYENDYQIRESSILSIFLDEDKMLDGCEDEADMNKFIDEIYDNNRIKIKSENIKAHFEYMDEIKPRYAISLIIEELPFLDTPASEFGL